MIRIKLELHRCPVPSTFGIPIKYNATGSRVIGPYNAEVLTRHSHIWYGHSKTPSHANHTNKLFSSFGGKRYRYIEKLIYANGIIYALGNVHTNGGGRNIPNNHQMTGHVIANGTKITINFYTVLTKKYRYIAFFSLIGLACCTGLIFSELFNLRN